MEKFIKRDRKGSDSDSDEDDFVNNLGSDEEFFTGGANNLISDDEDFSEEEEIEKFSTKKNNKKPTFDAFAQSNNNDEDDEEEDEEEPLKSEESQLSLNKKPESDEQKNLNELFRRSKLLKLKNKKPKGKTGIIYLSKIPPYMKPAKMRQILTRFGEVDRLFLKRETQQKYKQRVKQGGNKKPSYEEGWAEFIRKKDAKTCAVTLNGNKLGGKKGNFYYDDILNVKYLSGFKWADLTEQMSKENEIRQSKLQLEISQARKLNKAFIKNVESSKMIENIKSKKKAKQQDQGVENQEIRRTFIQRDITTRRADGDANYKQQSNAKLENVLSRVF